MVFIFFINTYKNIFIINSIDTIVNFTNFNNILCFSPFYYYYFLLEFFPIKVLLLLFI